MTDVLPRHPDTQRDLGAMLRRWVGAGLIEQDQADRIAAAEEEADRVVAVRPAASGYVIEALGYLGGALAAIAAFLAAGVLWPDMPAGAELAFAGTGAVVLLAAGQLIRPAAPPMERLRSVLWVVSTAATASFTAVLGAQVWRLSDLSTAQLTGVVAALQAVALWRVWPRTLQHVALFAALAVTVGTTVARLVPDDGDVRRVLGASAVWLFCVAWAMAARSGALRPRAAAGLAAAAGALISAQTAMDHTAGDVLGLITVAVLLTVGVVTRRVWLLGLGALGTVMVVPQVASRWLPANVSAPLAVLAVGLVLIAVAVRLARRDARPKG